MSTIIKLALVAVLAACGAKSNAGETPRTATADPTESAATCGESTPELAPLPPPVAAKPRFEDLGEGSCTK